jgi:hypothetical protein
MIKRIFNYLFSPIYKAIVLELGINYFTDDLVRLGKENDGGYVVLKSSLTNYKNLISFGIAGDISFEKDFQKFNLCKIFCFDPSIEKLPEEIPNTCFFKLGIDSSNYLNYVNLEKVLQLSGIDKNNKIFMKMDIEGYEWNILNDKSSFEILKNFDQIVIELHLKYLLGKSKYWMPFELIKRLLILKKLKKHFNFFNINANNVCGYINFSTFIFPEVIEVSMINKNYTSNMINKINQPSDPTLENIQYFIKN